MVKAKRAKVWRVTLKQLEINQKKALEIGTRGISPSTWLEHAYTLGIAICERLEKIESGLDGVRQQGIKQPEKRVPQYP